MGQKGNPRCFESGYHHQLDTKERSSLLMQQLASHDTPSKTLAKVIMRRLSVVVDLELHEEQAGLGARGCIGHILTLRNICKERTEWL